MHHNGKNAASILYPSPIEIPPYKSPLDSKRNRKRVREINEQTSSPNVNNTLKRQRRKLLPSLTSLCHQTRSKSTPSKSKEEKSRKRNIKKRRDSVEDWSETDQDYSDDDYLPPKNTKSKYKNDNNNKNIEAEYRKQVATPKFIEITSNAPSLMASASIMEIYGLESDKIEDTSNTAYFYRHYRAEAREKMFYEEVFESRLKHQQILERKQKRNKKEIIINDDDDDIDLSLPKLPKMPWSFDLGPEYDKRPQVPNIVTNRPKFNYDITDNCNCWVMPTNLIRRTDYGNMAQIKVEAPNKKPQKGKQELIDMIKMLNDKKNKKKHKHKKKSKHKNKNKNKNKSKRKAVFGPVDIRLSLNRD